MEMSKLGKKLIGAAREGVAIARGEMDPASYRLHVPAKINVKAMRQKLGMTQEEFAFRYGLHLGARARLGTGPVDARWRGARISQGH